MRIRIILAGRIREPYLKEGVGEYFKRLSRYATVGLIELPDEPVPEKYSEKELEMARRVEAGKILQTLKEEEYVVAMDIGGKRLSSVEFSQWLEQRALSGDSSLAFVIGSTTGLDPSVIARANFRLSMGPMTFPHQFMPLLLAEQIYRAFRIRAGEPYHR